MDNRWSWCGQSYTRCSEYRRGWGCECGCRVVNNRWRWSGDCYTRCSEYRCGCECRCCMVYNRRRGSRHELLNMHGRRCGERWSSEGVAETETSSKCRYRSCKGRAAVSNSRSSVMEDSGCLCGHCDPRCGKYRRCRCRYCETRSGECGSCVVNKCWRGSRHELLNMHGRRCGERWSSEGVAETETSSKCCRWSSEGSSAVSNSGSSVMDDSGCWCGHCDPRCGKYRRRRCGYCETRSSECGSCLVNNRWRRGRHELPNMYGRRGSECWSSESVAEAETRSKCCHWSSKGSTAVSNSRSSMMEDSRCWCGHCDPRCGKYRRCRCRYCETRSSECGSCVVNNCRRGSRHELLNMHGRWGRRMLEQRGCDRNRDLLQMSLQELQGLRCGKRQQEQRDGQQWVLVRPL
ncbi:hypothetical protein MTO96_022652 [Rhipicephalus appendiculatus]